jgi:uncharacterized protein
MRVFADTSALLKRYVQEQGTDEVNEVLQQASTLAVSAVAVVEATSALHRRWRAGDLGLDEYRVIHGNLLDELEDMDWIALDEATLGRAVALIGRHDLRTLDALQLASALTAAPDLFLCADHLLLAAARREGLATRDPAAGGEQP